MILDKITFIRNICPVDNIYDYVGLYYDHLTALSMLIPTNANYSVIQTNTDQNVFEVVIDLVDTSTASWVKSVIDLSTPNHIYQVYGRSLTINTFLNDNFLKISVS